MTQMFGYKFFITPEQLIYHSDTLTNLYTRIIHIFLGLDFPPEAHCATRILVQGVDVEDLSKQWSGVEVSEGGFTRAVNTVGNQKRP